MSSATYHSSRAADVNTFSPHSNNAGSPLPFIPRRRSSMPNSQAIFPFPPPNPVPPPANSESSKLSARNPSTVGGGSNPSESRPVSVRARRKIQPLLPLQPIEPPHISTFEFPRKTPALTASRSAQVLPPSRTIPVLALDEPDLEPDSAVTLSPSPSVDGNSRKKSGEPLKSSLKSRTPVPRPGLAVVTGSSKSEPATPNHVRSKSVSFADRLDHIKLFFAEQKPIAVSRDGTPTEDTSGTESEAPAPVRGISLDDEKKIGRAHV